MKKAFTMDQTWLQCIGCGHKADLLDERKFTCPHCGCLYDVMHAPLGLPFKKLMQLFDERAARSHRNAGNDPRLASGVWRFIELIMPYLPIENIITLGEGNSPIVPAGKNLKAWIRGGLDLWMILEGKSPTGSFKDYGMTVKTTIAKLAGIKATGCASTGDTSASIAAYAAAAGMKCVVILPRGKVTSAQLAQPLVHGAKVITLPGSFDDCMRVVRDLVEQEKLFPANSLNPTRIEGHQATVFLLTQFFGWEMPDWVVVPVGNGSDCSSVGKGIRTLVSYGYDGPTSHILGCQSRAACPLATSYENLVETGTLVQERWEKLYKPMGVGETAATAARIGDPVSRSKVMREILHSGGTMRIAEEQDLKEAVAVCGSDGHFVCPQTGMALAGLRQAVLDGAIPYGSRVAVVSTADGLKFTESATDHLIGNIIEAKDCEPSTVEKIIYS